MRDELELEVNEKLSGKKGYRAEIWDYTVSHGTLRLKLDKSSDDFRCVVVYMKDCDAVMFRSYWKNADVRVTSYDDEVGKRYIACYIANKAYFKKRGLKKKTVLHEFYHHLIEAIGLNLTLEEEEKEACFFSRSF